jgi:hypothetical protein
MATTPDRGQDPRWALVERVLASESLQSSPRLQELFRYLSECALHDPPQAVTEPQVGVAVFHRPPDYDTGVDTIVRVQVSQLRKKLERYFLSEGRQEPLVIDLPRGSYLPVFLPRTRAEEAVAPSAPAVVATTAPPPGSRDRKVAVVLAVGLAAALAAIAWLGHQNMRLRARVDRLPARPFLEHFWSQFFESGVPTQIALSDGGVLALAEAREKTVTLSEYRQAQYPQVVIHNMTTDEKARLDFMRIAARAFVPPAEAVIAHEVASLCERGGALCHILSARDLRVNLQAAENVILLGHTRANPWLELFEPALNFRYHFNDHPRRGEITNQAPQAGEERSYVADWGRRGYCAVASIPKPGGRGNVLLIFGADMLSVEAGGHLVSDEKAMSDLHGRLGIGLRDRVPYFEVLLQTKLQGNATGAYTVIAHRVVK